MIPSTVERILGSIYLSSYEGAAKFDGRKLCLHHDCAYAVDLHIPLLRTRPNSDTDRTGGKVNHKNLALISEIIEKHYQSGTDLCVHCRGGVERSPLALVHWLSTRRGYSWENAYALVKGKRSVVEDRTFWM